jgi:lysine 2,3-aminomutase
MKAPSFAPDRIYAALPPGFALLKEESSYFEKAARFPAFPFRVSGHFLSLIDPDDPDDPIRRQVIPRYEELSPAAYESPDPLAEKRFCKAPDLVHRYPDRAILKVTRACAAHCRFCFRKALYAEGADAISRSRLLEAAAYLARHPEIRELLLTGGDPLMLEQGRLREIFSTLRQARPDITFRIGTRLPVAWPARVTPVVADLLSAFRPLWATVHVNHARELGTQAAAALALLTDRFIRLGGQSVLLAGVNDSVETLAGLFRREAETGLRPYYLFHLDPAPGTAHFRVSLRRGIELIQELRRRFPDLALPVYALDLPDGGGKVPVADLIIENDGAECVILRDQAGNKYRYPR